MAWSWDAPTGVYKDHALSSDIREEAVRNFQFMRWFEPEPGYGRSMGQSATITRMQQLPGATRVSEADDLPSARPAITTKQITVSEWGQKIELTSKEELLTHFELNPRFRRFLRNQIGKTLDIAAADALKQSVVKAVPTGAGAVTFETGSTDPVATATVNLNISHLRDIRDYMSATLNVEPMSNGMWVGILSTKAARGIKNDEQYKDWLAPTDPGPFRDGRLRDVENIALFETNHVGTTDAALNNDLASGTLGEAIFFGMDAGTLVEALTPEIRAGLPRDLGRKIEVGWYGIVEAGLIWDIASQSKVVHVTSA